MEIRLVRSESFRLTAIFAAMLIGAIAVLGGGLYLIVDQAFRNEILLNAREDLAAIRKGYQAEGLSEAVEVVNQRLAKPTPSDVVVLETTSGRKIAGNVPAVAVTTGAKHVHLAAGQRRPHEAFGAGEMIGPGLYAFAGQDLYVLHETEEQAIHVIGWILAITLAMAIGGGLLLSRSFLRRTDAITRTCRAIMDGHLSWRIPKAGEGDELARLATVINSMLDRINDLMESNRQITNDIAHDLRTPLTRLRHRLELARAEAATTDDYAATIDGAIADTENILSTFSALLRIGQIEAGAGQKSFQRVDMGAVVRNLVEIYRPAAEDRNHLLCASTVADAEMLGDKELLSQMIVNLIENAILHTPPGTRIDVALEAERQAIAFTVSDNGPGVPAGERQNIFRRFYRLEHSRSSPGSGLGLSLVGAIAAIHRGRIEVADNDPGLRMTVIFPAQRDFPSTS
ncbi:MAG: HAMP domain-containing histidine kinase [Alphaproteobacteria bacterium]|nr:HAMP domain-containing histidine kinase [Alphaproteobacteria bacterium]